MKKITWMLIGLTGFGMMYGLFKLLGWFVCLLIVAIVVACSILAAIWETERNR